jgi:hypothetical protein
MTDTERLLLLRVAELIHDMVPKNWNFLHEPTGQKAKARDEILRLIELLEFHHD